jgi:hypothetical protein
MRLLGEAAGFFKKILEVFQIHNGILHSVYYTGSG